MVMAKKILYLDNTQSYGGAILSLKNLLKAIDRQRYHPIVVTGQTAEYLASDFAGFDVYADRFKLPWLHQPIYQRIKCWPPARWRGLKPLITGWRYAYWLLVHHLPDAWRYYRIGKKHQVELVHLNNILGSQLAGILAAKMLGVPCVAHLRDFENNTVFTRCYARLIDHHLAISSAIKNNLLALGVDENHITLVADAIDADEFCQAIDCRDLDAEFKSAQGTLKFALFGRIVAWKGVLEFVEAAALVIQQRPQVTAFIVGSAGSAQDPYFLQVVERITRLGLSQKIILTGYRADVARLMSYMDVIVHASISAEPFGMVIIEAMALARPVVATAAGGPLDIVEAGETGTLVPPADVPALAAAIVDLLDDPQRRQRYGRAGRRRVEERFTTRRSAAIVEALYARLIAEKSAATAGEHGGAKRRSPRRLQP